MLSLAETRSELGVVGDQYGAPTSARGIAKAITTLSHACPRLKVLISVGVPTITRVGHLSRGQNLHMRFSASFSTGDDLQHSYRECDSKQAIPTPAKRPHNSRLDCSKIKETFGIHSNDWHQSLEEVLNEIKGAG